MQTYDWIGIYLNFELNSFTHWHIFPRFSLQTVRPPSFVASSEFIIIFCKSNGSQLSLEIILWELWIEFDAYLVKLSEHILPLVAVTVLIRRHIFGRQSSYRWHCWNYCVRFTLYLAHQLCWQSTNSSCEFQIHFEFIGWEHCLYSVITICDCDKIDKPVRSVWSLLRFSQMKKHVIFVREFFRSGFY